MEITNFKKFCILLLVYKIFFINFHKTSQRVMRTNFLYLSCLMYIAFIFNTLYLEKVRINLVISYLLTIYKNICVKILFHGENTMSIYSIKNIFPFSFI